MIKSNTCPYCEGAWGMYEGCLAECAGSQTHRALIADAIDGDPGEQGEAEYLREVGRRAQWEKP